MDRGFEVVIDRLAREFWRAAHTREQQRAASEARSLAPVRALDQAQRALDEAGVVDAAARERLQLAVGQADAAARSARARYEVARLERLLADGLARDLRIPPADLRASNTPPVLDTRRLPKILAKPEWETFAPEKPGRLALAMPGASARYEQAVAKARSEFAHAEREYEASKIRRAQGSMILQIAQQKATEAARAESARHNAAVAEFEGALLRGEAAAITGYARIVLSRSPYPEAFTQTLAAHYVENLKLLAVGYDVPTIDAMVPTALDYHYNAAEGAVHGVPAGEAMRAQVYASALRQILLRSLHELFSAQPLRQVSAIVFNIYAGEGEARACLASVHAARADFAALALAEGDPAAHLAALGARLSPRPEALQPVTPVAGVDMTQAITDEKVAVDRRFNLATLSDKDFTQVMFHLLRSHGFEGPPLLPGENGMLSCRAWDPHPIFGGDVVVHIHRATGHRHRLGMGAARAMLAEMQQIGAARGMLITTGTFEDGVEEFARERRIELLAGHHLVFLLGENAGVDASVDVPETTETVETARMA
ncbi:restriction endonuclease [Pandoraea nosoerga]|uniref:restriction endonuclease n=1 Tax=Pandoraea nosoerga TaxID=2508296 RepID=UPI001980391E|nr:restriction endonuclease [Pandoraea nosoerga]MBN4665480.1 restriction endonuclease [Pandoraea nosoerga]MBN4675005.1 restriction endonuclease [Pandoraea nosoerga]MBN4680321.1 restriction endonuclease [Pandoraea nosoerga]MBN4744446.1 restriction endonuclease [Pandoraea nosoerga]